MVDLAAVETLFAVCRVETVALGEPADQFCSFGESSWAVAGAEFGRGFVAMGAGGGVVDPIVALLTSHCGVHIGEVEELARCCDGYRV